MGDHHHGHTLIGQLFHDLQHLAHHFRVQGGGWLVKQQHLGLHGQGTDDGNTLFLTAGDLIGIGVGLILQTHAAQQVQGRFIGLLLGHQTGTHRGQGDILPDGHIGKQVEMLEHHAHFPADGVNIGFGIGDLRTVEGDDAFGGVFQQIHAPQECGFTGAGRPDDNHFFSGIDVFRNVLEDAVVVKGLG